jgi:hypothetical protein
VGEVEGRRLEALVGLRLVFSAKYRVTTEGRIDRGTALWLVALTLAGGALRLYGLSWGAPYYHFHIDEHFVFVGADLLRGGMQQAALSPKFFMYSPLPMYLVNLLRAVYETVVAPLNLNVPADEVVYMVLGRGISAVFGTATIPLVFFVARRVAGRTAGLLAAALLAFATLHVRDSHFFSVDISLVFFCVLTWLAAVAIADTGRTPAYAGAGVAFGLALLCKYTALFLIPLIGIAHLCSPRTPRSLKPLGRWGAWALVGLMPVVVGMLVFLALDPMVVLYFDKFLGDFRDQITGPLLGGQRPIYNAHFRDIQPQLFWFVNLLPWGLGPAFAVWGVAGVVWLLTRRTRLALVAAAYPIVHYAVAGQTVTPFIRYSLPLIPGLAVAGAVLSANLLAHPRWRRPAQVCTVVVLATTVAWALAFMNVYVGPDPRLEASRELLKTVPKGAAILVEPSHNIPPTGEYLTAPSFYEDYVGWGCWSTPRNNGCPETTRRDYYVLHTLDVYRYLYDPRPSTEEKRAYIARRVAGVDYILMDDTFMEFYAHLPDLTYRAVRDYYSDLFEGRLGFTLKRQFTRRPSLFGVTIDDDPSELTFTLFDHPEIYLFERVR